MIWLRSMQWCFIAKKIHGENGEKKEKWPDDQSQILHNIFSPFFSFLLLFSPFEISNSRISLLRGSVFNNHAKSCYICTKLLVKILPAWYVHLLFYFRVCCLPSLLQCSLFVYVAVLFGPTRLPVPVGTFRSSLVLYV